MNYLKIIMLMAMCLSGLGVPNVIVSVASAVVKTPKASISAVDSISSETHGDGGQFMSALDAPTTHNVNTIAGKTIKGKDYQKNW